MNGYCHRQNGHLDWLLLGIFAALLIVAFFLHATPFGFYLTLMAAGLVLLASACFSWLEVKDDGNWLSIQYGPLRLFHKRLDYGDIRNVKQSRSRLIDGWGIHYVPGRGWTYNLWGFDCVEMNVGSSRFRIGTDDADNLAAFLQSKIRADQ